MPVLFVSDTSYGIFSRTATSWAILAIRGASHKTEFVPNNSRLKNITENPNSENEYAPKMALKK